MGGGVGVACERPEKAKGAAKIILFASPAADGDGE